MKVEYGFALTLLFVLGCSSSNVEETNPWQVESKPEVISGVFIAPGTFDGLNLQYKKPLLVKAKFYPITMNVDSSIPCESWVDFIQSKKGYTFQPGWFPAFEQPPWFYELKGADVGKSQRHLALYVTLEGEVFENEIKVNTAKADACKIAQLSNGCAIPHLGEHCVIGSTAQKHDNAYAIEATTESLAISTPEQSRIFIQANNTMEFTSSRLLITPLEQLTVQNQPPGFELEQQKSWLGVSRVRFESNGTNIDDLQQHKRTIEIAYSLHVGDVLLWGVKQIEAR